jgi:hypothetical protein
MREILSRRMRELDGSRDRDRRSDGDRRNNDHHSNHSNEMLPAA